MMNGVLLIDKPQGLTSHDVVLEIKRTLRIKKVGHAGTLDPLATGLLVALLGKASRLSQYLITQRKSYKGEMVLGKRTDTFDANGKIIEDKVLPNLTKKKILSTFKLFTGEIEQKPPMFSAVKKNGQKLYDLARQNKEIDRDFRKVTIFALGLKDINLPKISFDVDCSKGTYIRSLVDDIGIKLGCGAHLSSLRRLKSGHFEIEKALTLDDLKKMGLDDIRRRLISFNEVLTFPKIVIKNVFEDAINNGQKLNLNAIDSIEKPFKKDEFLNIQTKDGKMIAIYQALEDYNDQDSFLAKAKTVFPKGNG